MQGQAEVAIIRWQVESISGSSPVSSISITSPELNYSSSNLTGQCNVNILSYPYPTKEDSGVRILGSGLEISLFPPLSY